MFNEQPSSEKIVAFEAQRDDLKLLAQEGAQKFFSTEFPDLKHAFLPKLECVVCIDEGTAHKDLTGEAKFCLAGSGILFPAQNEAERIGKVAKLMIDLGITDITSHSGCGAAGLAYKRDFSDAKPTSQDIENYAIAWSQKLADKINELQYEAAHSHITIDEMMRPAEFHNARVVYFDGAGGFNPDKEIDLPMGFVIERKFVPADYAVEELKVAVSIAFGHHGLGELFTKDEPFVIVVFASSVEELEKLIQEAKNVLSDNEFYLAGRIKIDGMVV